MIKTSLRKSVLAVLGVTAMAGFSTQASALGGTLDNLGVVDIGSAASKTNFSQYRSWSDYGSTSNLGWVHTVNWYTLQIGPNADITAGNTLDVEFKMEGISGTFGTLENPGFSIWTSGANPFTDASGFHSFNQVRGANDGGITTNNTLVTGAATNPILDGRQGWVGYANAGPEFTTSDGDNVSSGGWNTDTGTAVLGSGSMVEVAAGSATLTLDDLKAGHYLIASGGSCPDDGTCGLGDHEFTVTAVPLPAAVWLFGSALMGLAASTRRKKALTMA